MKNNKSSFGGFYAAMAVCLLGAVAAAWVTAGTAINSLNEQSDVPKAENRVISDENYNKNDSIFASEDVGKPKEDVKIEKPQDKTEKNPLKPANKGTTFIMPVKGEIIGSHSSGELVKYEALGEWRTHDGIDIKAEAGSEIKAAADGKIKSVSEDPLWGTVIEIEHEKGIVTLYYGLAKEVPVKAGDEVKSGDVIGTLGETNLAEVDKDSHLHFAMKENGKFIDPKEKIK